VTQPSGSCGSRRRESTEGAAIRRAGGVPLVDRFGRYWLLNCVGFRVEGARGRSGIVEEVGLGPEGVDVLAVRRRGVPGGIVLSQWVAHHFNTRRTSGETLAIYAEKGRDDADKRFFFGRGYDRYIPGKNILVVEDVLTTGGSALQVIELVRGHGGNIVGLSALCNRGSVQPADVGDVPVQALVTIALETYTAEECPFCRDRVPVNTTLGKGRAFLANRQVI